VYFTAIMAPIINNLNINIDCYQRNTIIPDQNGDNVSALNILSSLCNFQQRSFGQNFIKYLNMWGLWTRAR
jgi:hypothetical protein